MTKVPSPSFSGAHWIYGTHAVQAALANPRRTCYEALIIKELSAEFAPFQNINSRCKFSLATRQDIARQVGQEAVHQGCAVRVSPLPDVHLEDIVRQESAQQLIVALDQVTDPHNVGAILRSCAAFGASALLQVHRNAAPKDSAVLAKAASGALEQTPLVFVSNLASALTYLKDHHFWCVGLDERGDLTLPQVDLTGKTVLVMGSEGDGLRRLTGETCDYLVRLPTNPTFPTLNVSTAAAVCLYQFAIAKGNNHS